MTKQTTSKTAEQTIAMSDFRIINDLVLAVQRMQAEKKNVVEADLRTLSAYADALAQSARTVETLMRVGDNTGVAHRHPEAWATAVEGDIVATADHLRSVMEVAYGR